ncbi:MAG: hypothetical protein KBA50_03100 [Sedimentibacter sp.]|nr:hypothetical protein [Sedimentibacter sp.]
MFKNSTYRQKFIYLLVGGFVILWFIYIFSIKETLKIKKQYNEIKEKTESVSDATASILFYEKELKKIDSLVGSDSYIGNYTQEQLLEGISGYSNAHSLNIVSFPAPHEYSDNDYRVLTYKAVVAGGYIDLLNLLFELETKHYPGVIKSVDFSISKQNTTGTSQLLMTLFIQDIKEVTHE